MKKDSLVNTCTALLVLLFAYTSASKFLDYHRFVFQMGLSPLPLVKFLAPYLGIAIPIVEGILVFMLLSSKYRLKGLWGSLILLCLFESYIIGMLISGLDLPCTCGGIISTLTWKQHVLFNAFFIILTIITLRLSRIRSIGFKPADNHKIFHAHEQQGNRYL